MCVHERIGYDIQRVDTSFERLQGGADIFCLPGFARDNLKAKRASRGLNFVHFQCANGCLDISHDSHPAQAGDDTTQQRKSLAGKIG